MALYIGRKLVASIQKIFSWGDLQGNIADQTDLQNALNAKVNKTTTINNKALSNNILLNASDVGALSSSTKYGADLSYSNDTLQLKDQDGNNLGTAVTIESAPSVDGDTISYNASDELQTIAVIDNRDSTPRPIWTGTRAQYNALQEIDDNILYNITDDDDSNAYINITRTLGQIVTSTIPLVDSGLHLLDGSLISGSGAYAGFVDYMADLYETLEPSATPEYNIRTSGNLENNNGVLSGFSASNYATIPFQFNPHNSEWEINLKFATQSDVTTAQALIADEHPYSGLELFYSNTHFDLHGFINNTDTLLFHGTGTYTILPNTTYYIKIAFTGSAYTLDYSLDGTDYINDISVNSTTPITPLNLPLLGVDVSAEAGYPKGMPMAGSIDLEGCNFVVGNDTLWKGESLNIPCFCTEEEWQASVINYGVCGKFVYDSVNNTLRLPKITGFIEGTGENTYLGSLVEAGLPNMQGSINILDISSRNLEYDGCLDMSHKSGNLDRVDTISSSEGGSGTSGTLHIDASLSNSIYGNSSTVQPQAVKVLYYVVIATIPKTEIEVDIDNIATDLNGKADVDLTNVNDSGTSRGAGWGMPSSSSIAWTVGASGSTYVAPANGWVIMQGASTSSFGYATLYTSENVNMTSALYSSSIGYKIYVPVHKGSIITLGYSNVSISVLNFVYAIGSESEAS